MKFILLSLLLGFLCSCSEDRADIFPELPDIEDPDTPGPSPEKYKLRIKADKNKLNIFDLSSIYLTGSDEEGLDVSFSELRKVYDSITWSVADQQGRLSVFRIKEGDGFVDMQLKMRWSHTFYVPGNYDTYLHCYKDNQIIHSDTLTFEISNNKDFLMYDWCNVTEQDKGGTGYNNALDYDYTLSSIRNIYPNTPAIRLYFQNTTEEALFAEKSKEWLYDYICSIYGKPEFDTTSTSLAEKYQALFLNQSATAVPCAIWITDKTKMVLLFENTEDYKRSRIHAEPV